jgi:anti-anti-sigma regulatory factor
MSSFHAAAQDHELRLRLEGELGIEQAAQLQTTLRPLLDTDLRLLVDATDLTRADVAVLQILTAAALASPSGAYVVPSAAWNEAFRRYGLADPFSPTV